MFKSKIKFKEPVWNKDKSEVSFIFYYKNIPYNLTFFQDVYRLKIFVLSNSYSSPEIFNAFYAAELFGEDLLELIHIRCYIEEKMEGYEISFDGDIDFYS